MIIDKKRISCYLLYLVNTANIEGLASKIFNNPSYTSLFNETELAVLQQAAVSDEIELPDLLLHNDWGISSVSFIRKYKLLREKRKENIRYNYKDITKILFHGLTD